MLHPIQYHIGKAYPAAVPIDKPPFVLSYPLDYPCDRLYFKHPHFGMAIQQHDAHDVFETVLEVHTKIALEIPISCRMNDLHLLYQLKGTTRFASTDDQQAAEFTIRELFYRMVYRSKSEALLCVPPGDHLLVGLVIQRDWLLRSQKKISTESLLSELLPLLEQEKPVCRHSVEIYFNDLPEVQLHIQTLLHLREAADMEMDLAVYTPSIALFRKNQQLTVAARPAPVSQLVVGRVEAIRASIRQLIRNGTRPHIPELAAGYHKSVDYFKETHLQLYVQSLKDFILQEQLDEAKRWLADSTHSIKEVAFHLDFNHVQSFSRWFSTYALMSPSDYIASLK